MEKIYTVYVHVFPNGKRYVGITKQKVERRWRKGESYKHNHRLYNAIHKYGWNNVKHIILAVGLTAEQAEQMEKRLISEWNLLDADLGYNNAEGGSHPNHTEKTRAKIGAKSLGRKHSEDFKKWISEKNSGENNFMYGKHHTEETKQKISAAKKGKSPAPNKGKFGANHPASKSVIMVDRMTGDAVKIFPSIREASAYIGRAPSGINAVLHGHQNVSGGYGWKYAE